MRWLPEQSCREAMDPCWCMQLAGRLDSVIEKATGAWPKVKVKQPIGGFVEHLARCVGGEEDFMVALDRIHAADLYLAWACLHDEPSAISAFEQRLAPGMLSALRRLGGSKPLMDDVIHGLQERLLVGEKGAPPLIREYGGRGPLRNWLRSIAVREGARAQRLARREQPTPEGELQLLVVQGEDPELLLLKQTYAPQFSAAFGEALAQLSCRQRNILRHQVVDGLSIDEIGALYHVHRATAARWLADCRQILFDTTLQLLMNRLGADQSAMESIVRLVHSQLEISVARLLGK
ncbi:MAG: sigma-70 family RNA polymerase sigma factor [Pseudomonadota bacterium]